MLIIQFSYFTQMALNVDSGIYSKTCKTGMTVLKDMHDGKQSVGMRKVRVI